MEWGGDGDVACTNGDTNDKAKNQRIQPPCVAMIRRPRGKTDGRVDRCMDRWTKRMDPRMDQWTKMARPRLAVEDHGAAGAAERLVRGGGDHVGVVEGRGNHTRRNQTRDVRLAPVSPLLHHF